MMKTIIRSLKMTLLLSLLLPAAIALVIANVRAQESSSPSAGTGATKSDSTTKMEAATQKADTEWEGVSVELSPVTRGDGDTITIKFKYTNSGSKAANITSLGQFSGYDNIAAKVYYVDGKNKKKYLVVKDAEGNAVASNLKNVEIEAGASRGGWAKFPAPPVGVDKITVYLPGAPPFESVTIAAP